MNIELELIRLIKILANVYLVIKVRKQFKSVWK